MALGEVLSNQSRGMLEQIVGYGVGGAATPVVEWAARPIAYKLNAANPNLVLDPQTLALIQMRLSGSGYDGSDEAAKSGLDDDRYTKLLASLFAPPSNGEILELMRRGVLADFDGREALSRNGLDARWIDNYLDLKRILMSPENLAMARQQGFIEEAEAHTRSLVQGVEPQDADLLFEMSGLPPGVETALEMLRRGIIDQTVFGEIVREGHTKTKYIDVLLQMQTTPLSASTAAGALVKERVTQDRAVAIAAQNGLAKDDFLLMADAIGRPISITEGLTLIRRGKISKADFREIVARSDVRTEYTDDLLELQLALPPLFQVSRMIANGSITDAKATEILLDEGYDTDIVHGLIGAAHSTKTAHTKNLAATQIDLLYESGLETRDWATKALQGLGYDPDEAEWHLELLDARRLLAALQSDLNLIHRLYVTHKIDQNEAMQDLDKLGMATNVRDLLMQQWDNERAENVQRLTNSQISRSFALGILEEAEAIARLMSNGYSSDDALIVLELAVKGHLDAPSATG